jgi:hypothetical protein
LEVKDLKMIKFHQFFRLLKKKDWKLPAET